MNMRLLKISAVVLAVAAAGAVVAQEHHRHMGGFFRRHVNMRIEGALDAAKATPDQRATIERARDKVFATVENSHNGRQEHMQKVMALFEADKIDPAQVKALREQHDTTARADADAIVAAISEAHDVLRPDQRKAVADYLRAHKPDAPPRAVADWFKKRAFSHVNDALDQVKANEQQRTAVENAIEQVWNAFHAEHEAMPAHLDQALKLFEADKVDPAQLAALRAQGEARRQKISDAIVQAFHDVHDALTAAQRKQLVAWVRANHAQM
jgi:Spy/CpxP family protein refolding chaperone